MTDLDMSLSGVDELNKALGTFGMRTERNLVIKGLRAGGKVVILHATRNAPSGREGKLRSKKSYMTKAGRFRPGREVVLHVGTRKGKNMPFYAHLVEFGTAHSKPEPFMRPALDEHAPEIIDAIAARLTLEIPKEILKAGK